MVNENEEEVMTPEEFKERMRDAADAKNGAHYDIEDSHRAMDRVMCELLRELGYGEGVDIFEDEPKWYA